MVTLRVEPWFREWMLTDQLSPIQVENYTLSNSGNSFFPDILTYMSYIRDYLFIFHQSIKSIDNIIERIVQIFHSYERIDNPVPPVNELD